MAQIFHGLDPTLVFLVLVPTAAAIAAWALQLACKICDVEVPDYLHCLLAIIVVAIANVVLRFWLRVNQEPLAFGAEWLAPVATTILVLSVLIRTGPINACKVLLVHGLLCGTILGAVLAVTERLPSGLV